MGVWDWTASTVTWSFLPRHGWSVPALENIWNAMWGCLLTELHRRLCQSHVWRHLPQALCLSLTTCYCPALGNNSGIKSSFHNISSLRLPGYHPWQRLLMDVSQSGKLEVQGQGNNTLRVCWGCTSLFIHSRLPSLCPHMLGKARGLWGPLSQGG